MLFDTNLKEDDINNNAFSLMLQREDGTYEESNSDTWPAYMILNDEKSGCVDVNNNIIENALSFNSDANTVRIKTRSSCYCYLYFDLPQKYTITLELKNATSDELVKEIYAKTNYDFNISGDTGYKFANYICTNGQNGNFNNGIFTIESITNNTTCTISYVQNLSGTGMVNYKTQNNDHYSYYKVRIYGNVPDGTTGSGIYEGDDWSYNEFLNCYEKEFKYLDNITIPDPSEMFLIDGYKDNNNYTRVIKELDGFFWIVPIYESVRNGVLEVHAGSIIGNCITLWPRKDVLNAATNNQRMVVKKIDNGYYHIGTVDSTDPNEYKGVFEPANNLLSWDGLDAEINHGYYKRFEYSSTKTWKQIKFNTLDETSTLQQWALIYDSHGNFFIKNKETGDYVRNGSTACNYPDCKRSAVGSDLKYSSLNLTWYDERTRDETVNYIGNYEIPIITVPLELFKEEDANRYSFVNIDSMLTKDIFYNSEYYKYLRYSDSSLEFYYDSDSYNYVFSPSSDIEKLLAFKGTITESQSIISKGTSDYALSDIDGDIIHLYPSWIKE